MEKKRYKVMAYILSSGLWDAFGDISLQMALGCKDAELEAQLAEWQASYDDQFKAYPYRFDWAHFNRQGEELTRRISAKLPPEAEIFYEPSDDREFFGPEDCCESGDPSCDRRRKHDLREKKRALLFAGIAG